MQTIHAINPTPSSPQRIWPIIEKWHATEVKESPKVKIPNIVKEEPRHGIGDSRECDGRGSSGNVRSCSDLAIKIVNRVPCRIHLLLILSASHLILYNLHDLHFHIHERLYPHELLKEQLDRVTALIAFLTINYTLIILFGCQDRGPQATESQKVRSGVPLTDIQGRQEDKDKIQECSGITRKSDIPLWNPRYRHLKMLPSHNSSAGHAICEVCKWCERFGAPYEESFKTCHLGMDCTQRKLPTRTQHNSTTHTKRGSPPRTQHNAPTGTQRNPPTYLFLKAFDRLFSYRMAVVIWCIMIVYGYVPRDIHLLTAQSQHTLFLVREDGIVRLTVEAVIYVCGLWLLSIPVFYLVRWFFICLFYLIRWFVLPVLYFCMAWADPRISFFTVCDNAIEIARFVEDGSEWSKTSIVVGWLKDFGVAIKQAEQAEQAEQAKTRNEGSV